MQKHSFSHHMAHANDMLGQNWSITAMIYYAPSYPVLCLIMRNAHLTFAKRLFYNRKMTL